ncbi:MAG TPA: hypothetical protein VGM64_07715 [Lacunisphaera sp.]|jgi:hypothetical protein
MESENINPSFPENDEFEPQWRAHFSAPAIPDEGFSERVLAALPSVENRPIERRRRWFCAVGLVAGVAISALGLIISNDSSPSLPQFVNGGTAAAAQFFSDPVMLALGLTACSLWFAFRDRWRLLPRW